MKTFFLSVLALGFIWQASAMTVTAYADAPSVSIPDSGCKTPLPAGPIVTAGFINPFNCPLNTCCFYQNRTEPGQATISSWWKVFDCTETRPGFVGSYTYQNFLDANCTTSSGVGNTTATNFGCRSQVGSWMTGIRALRATCSPPGSPSPTPGPPPPSTIKSLGAVAFLSTVALVVAALVVCL